MTTIPNMILDPEERRCAIFDSRNGLVEDPVAERDRINLIRPWTKAEKAIFHERFASYGKNFRRIAEHLEGRDTGDCVMYYYKFQKTDDGFRGRRRAAMKKRRAFADAQRMRAIDPATIEAQREERAAPTAEARLERAALAAAAKAAKAKARAEKAKIKAAKEAEEAKQNASKTPSKGPEWTDMEKTKFVSGLLQYGKDFVAISSTIRTRSLDAVKQFYEDKTAERVGYYLKRFEQNDKPVTINGVGVDKATSQLELLDWAMIYNEIHWSRFHGDLHGENVLLCDDHFILLDWRQNFGGVSLDYGDAYYDFAKIHHGLIVNHGNVNKNLFSVHETNPDEVFISIERKSNLVDAEETLFEWLRVHGFDEGKVKTLTALIFLNIAGLHDYPYSKFLFFLGRLLLQKQLTKMAWDN